MSSDSHSPPVHQLLHIVNGLNSQRNLTANVLSGEMAVSERTVKRYIKYLREELNLDIIWEPTSKSYYCERPFEYFPLLQVTGDEALSLALAGRTFAAWKGSPLGDALESVIRKVAKVVEGAVTIPISDLQGILSLPDDQISNHDEYRWFGVLLEAIKRNSKISIQYKKPNQACAEARIIHPLHLVYVEQSWAVVSWEPQKQQPRKFRLSRIDNVQATGDFFSEPEGFDKDAYIHNSFGLFSGNQLHQVRVKCDRQVTPYLKEKPLHTSQVLKEFSDGSCIMTLKLNHLLDIQRWILSWGQHVEVLEPLQLRKSVHTEIKALLEIYEQKEQQQKSYSQGQDLSQVVG